MASKKAPAKAAKAAKPVKEVMNKSGLVNFIAEQSGVAHLLEQFVGGEYLCRFPFVDEWIDFLIDESGNGVAQISMFLGIKHCSVP